MDKATEQTYNERDQRIIDAIQLKVPDRVPTTINLSYFPAIYAGVTCRDAYYDFPKWKDAYLKTALWLQPDRCEFVPAQSGNVMEILDTKTLAWPGYRLGNYSSHQFVEGEHLKEDEYDHFLEDPSDFTIRVLLPRLYGFLKPLSKLPPLESTGNFLPFQAFADPEFVSMFKTLTEIAQEGLEWQQHGREMSEALKESGFPSRASGMFFGVPYDMISDFLRGMRGSMLDMYRRPDKLMAAIEKYSRNSINQIAKSPKPSGFSTVFIALHRGSDGFMSIKQFEKFYWPYLSKLAHALVDAGFTPEIFFEGDYTNRLHYLKELPKGKVLARFDRSDMAKVKEVLGGHICVTGNVPSSLLQMGDTEAVIKYCKWLIDVVGEGGGYIMGTGSVVDQAKPENLKAMVDFTRDYGKY